MPTKLKPGIVTDVAITALERDPKQPRKSFPEDSLKALAVSLAERIEVPLSVRVDGKRLVIVDGERRWRAAKLAKLKTLPCLLAELDEQLAIASSQLTTAVHREALAPLDIGEFLVELRKRENKSLNEMMAELAKRGITEIGAAKIDRYMALMQLPDWAKQMMREGHLQEGHGTAILQAMNFPAVMKEIKEECTNSLHWCGSITVKEIQQDVEQAFRSVGIDLNQKHGKADDIRAFPISVCDGCAFYKRIGKAEYCLNEKEFKRKQDEALVLKAEKEARKASAASPGKPSVEDIADPTKVPAKQLKVSAQNIVTLKLMKYGTYNSLADGNFDKEQCATCPHNHIASHDGTVAEREDTCFHPPCFNRKQHEGKKHESRAEKLREYFETYLRPVVRKYISIRLPEENRIAILLWMATGAIDHVTPYTSGQRPQQLNAATSVWLKQGKVESLPHLLELAGRFAGAGNLMAMDLLPLAVDAMTREQVRFMALHMKIDLHDPEQSYRIDDAYLKLKRRAELLDFCKLIGMETVAGLSVAEIKNKLLEEQSRAIIGVPTDIEKIYAEPFEKPADDDDFDDFGIVNNDDPDWDPMNPGELGELVSDDGVADVLASVPIPTKPKRGSKSA